MDVNLFDLAGKKINFEKISVDSVCILSLLAFYIWMTVYALLVFQQFSIVEIISVSIVYILIVSAITLLFVPFFFRFKLRLTFQNILLVLPVLFLMILLASTQATWQELYYPTFPLNNADSGLFVHRDSLFHASIIQSILNFGYPSIAQHGTPMTFYHVLSHYIDAFIIIITGLEVYDSYGLLFHFKNFTLIAVITIFLGKTTVNYPKYVFFLSFLVLAPIIIGTGHAIGSHGLWFTSILVILSVPKVFDIIVQENSISNKNYLFIFFLIVFIAFGKVSTGFMYAVFIGIFLLLKDFKSFRVYLLGITWSLFFAVYQSLMSGSSSESIQPPSFSSMMTFVTNPSQVYFGTLFSLYISIGILVLLSLLFKNKQTIRMMMSGWGASIILVVITQTITTFSKSDVWYFVYGLTSVVTLFVFQAILLDFKHLKVPSFMKTIKYNSQLIKGLLVSLFILSTSYFEIASFNVFTIDKENIEKRLHSINRAPFLRINKELDVESAVSIKKLVLSRKFEFLSNNHDASLINFRAGLVEFMSIKGLDKTNSLLYIPKNIFEQDLTKFNTQAKVHGMLVYAVVGVPLIHGIESLGRAYGYSDYNESSLWRDYNAFELGDVCETNKSIIVVERWSIPDFKEIRCP